MIETLGDVISQALTGALWEIDYWKEGEAETVSCQADEVSPFLDYLKQQGYDCQLWLRPGAAGSWSPVEQTGKILLS